MLELSRARSTAVLGEQSNPLGDEGAAALAAPLHRNRALRTLDLRGCGVTGVGAALLAAALGENQVLTELKLGKGIAQRLKQQIRQALLRNQAAAHALPPPPRR